MKKKLFLLSFIIIICFACTSNKKTTSGNISVTIAGCYSSTDFFPLFEKANEILSDSIYHSNSAFKAVQADTTLTLSEQIKNGPPVPKLQETNPLFSVFSPPTETKDGHTSLNQSPVVGYCRLKDTAAINKYLSLPYIASLFPPGTRFEWVESMDPTVLFLSAIQLKKSAKELFRNDISGIIIKKSGNEYGVLNLIGINLTGKQNYSATITLKDYASAGAYKTLSNNQYVLVTVSLNGKKYLLPVMTRDIIDGFTISTSLSSGAVDSLKANYGALVRDN